ncbi:unnamed protein product [Durusdinium trenchii]|uniref:SET domain-containing protein n=1 Tax=Durusdinium trenchii TaxID=1381693 RepID=A0ABP0QL25_9DINO
MGGLWLGAARLGSQRSRSGCRERLSLRGSAFPRERLPRQEPGAFGVRGFSFRRGPRTSLSPSHRSTLPLRRPCRNLAPRSFRGSSSAFPGYSKVRFNSFELNGCCFLPIMALFNHSCAPNAAITQLPPHEECHTAMVVVAEQGIARGTEIVYSYNSDCLFVPLRERRKRLLSNWGFLCKCSRCQVEEEAGLEDDEEEPPEMPQLLSWEEVDLKNVNLFQARHEVLHHPGIPFSERKQIFSAQLAAAVQLAP